MVDRSRLETLASSSEGDSVTVESLAEPAGDGALHRLLEDGEQPHYLLSGRILDVVDSEKSESDPARRSRKIAATGSALRTLVTDEHILAVIPRRDGIEPILLPYAEVSSADTETAPGGNRRLRVYTSTTDYYIDVSQSEGPEVDAAAEYVNGRGPVGNSDNSTTGGDADEILDTIERLADLHERGALTDAEFKEKKSEILDRL